MESNIVDILKKIRGGLLDPKKLTTSDRRTCVVYLRLEGCTQEEIAEILKVHRLTIIRDEKANHRETAKLVDEIDVKSIAGNTISLARHLIAKALREKDYALAWKIWREKTSDLQSLGYLPRSPEQHQVQIGTFLELVQLANMQPVEAKKIKVKAKKKKALPSARGSKNNARKGK